MNRFNKVANIEGNRVHISAMKTTMSMATYFMAIPILQISSYYDCSMYLKEFDNLTIN
jgi:hypothetical protein